MIYPEEDEDNNTNYIPREYPFSITSLKTRSPTLPLHFDRRYLPRDLCQKQIITLTECLMLYNIHAAQIQQMCRLQSSKFQSCRRRRDLRILNGIHKWETNHWQNLDSQNKGMYLMGLNRKLTRLEEDYKRQPSTISGLKRAQNIETEIKQLRWRLDYLNKLKTTIQK